MVKSATADTAAMAMARTQKIQRQPAAAERKPPQTGPVGVVSGWI
jgi:hypothetical protein